jgi:hypothetical protein
MIVVEELVVTHGSNDEMIMVMMKEKMMTTKIIR